MDTKYNKGTKFLLVKDPWSLQHPKQEEKKKEEKKWYTQRYTQPVFAMQML